MKFEDGLGYDILIHSSFRTRNFAYLRMEYFEMVDIKNWFTLVECFKILKGMKGKILEREN